MGWTYTGDPTNSQVDEVRFLTGDTDRKKPWTLQDEEIQYAITTYPTNVLLAAAICAESVLAKLKGTVADKRVGDLSITYNNNMLAEFGTRAYQLRQRATLKAVKPYAGGASKSEKQGQDQDPDRVAPAVKVDGMTMISPEPNKINWP